MSKLDGALAKVSRAEDTIGTLAEVVNAYLLNACSVDAQPDWWTEPDRHGEVIITARASMPPPSEEWGAIIGDIIHGLRSSLDHLVWALSVAQQGLLGIAPPVRLRRHDPWADVAFPIVIDEKDWKSRAGQALKYLDASERAGIRVWQPFVTGSAAPDHEPLALLHEFWNIDKHRHLHLVNTTAELADVLSVRPFPGAAEVEFEVVSKMAPGPLLSEAEVGRARLIPGKIVATTLPQMHMNARVFLNVAFTQGPPAHGALVVQTLADMAQTVRSVLDDFS